MALNIWDSSDIAHILAALAMASGEQDGEYRRGYLAALAAVAVACGCTGEAQVDTWREAPKYLSQGD